MDRRVTHIQSDRPADPERLSRAVWASLGLHVGLAALLIASPWLFPGYGELWGSEDGGGGISVSLVSNTSGLPLPAPPNARTDAIGNDSPGLYQPPPEPAPAAPEEAPVDAEAIPEQFDLAEAEAEDEPEPDPEPTPPPAPVRPEPTPRPVAPRPSDPPAEVAANIPDNAVPFGEGGRPDVSGGEFGNDQGMGGFQMGDGAFGRQNATYVNAMIRKISNSWLQSMVNASVPNGSRVTLSFNVLRDGQISDVDVVERSGNPSLDDSAVRAIYRSSPLQQLPLSYRGSSISVQFWFEFRR